MFLVKIKFCQTQVNNLFYINALSREEILLKRKMTEFINSFWSYIQMDVISVKYSQFMSSMDTLNYHDILQTHSKILDQIEIGCFLRNSIVLKRINSLTKTMHQISALISGPRNSDYSHTLQELVKTFDKDFKFLVKVFAGLAEASSLLCVLDFNRSNQQI